MAFSFSMNEQDGEMTGKDDTPSSIVLPMRGVAARMLDWAAQKAMPQES